MKLEVTELIWIVKKIKHIIETATQKVIIYTNHAASVDINWQSSLNITAMKKLNLYLIQTFKYLQYFHLNIHYKLRKLNIILDTLFWLLSNNNICECLVNQENKTETDIFILKDLYTNLQTAVYVRILMKVSDKLWQNIKYRYIKESRWKYILQMLERNNALRFNVARLLYEVRNDLIFYKDLKKESYLCILKSLHDQMFKIAHDNIDYLEYKWMHKRLTDSLYFYNLLKNLHNYIQHCLQCQNH